MRSGASLHTRLTVGVLVLTALGLLLAALATNLLLRTYLVAALDQQLQTAPRFNESGAQFPQAPSGSTTGRPALPSPFVITRLDAQGQVLEQIVGTQAQGLAAPDVAGLTLAQVQDTHGEAFDVTSADGSASYRALAVPSRDGTFSVVVAIPTTSAEDTARKVALASLAVGLFTLGLVGLVSRYVIRVGLRPLDQIEQTAERIAAGDLSERVPEMPEGTEIGRLSDSLNTMLGQIEEAFDERAASEERLRRFVSDASHELRTPLTAIRGYAELSRSGVYTDDESRTRAAARIEEEAARMGVLVDDMLLLARLDQQRPLERAPLDVAEVVEAAAEGLRAAAPDRDVAVTVDGPAEIVGDAMRLRQVIDNLATNARVHTTPGTPISFSVTASQGWATIEVADAGPGMDPVEVERAFERFYRGDASRTRARGAGTGLGLSIAQAVVAAYRGEVSLGSSPEGGTRVTL
ncbi:MAG TPA: HAMP domain-containing sensor histidine kinase, partial [Candidatus Nanopelagicales bacterium]|nr:HAMP domain-containing sensor histidine kinase [Candidatus Nanopelagicales bacterium]